jgi:hypothetical protein
MNVLAAAQGAQRPRGSGPAISVKRGTGLLKPQADSRLGKRTVWRSAPTALDRLWSAVEDERRAPLRPSDAAGWCGCGAATGPARWEVAR